jgi:hypothetical protein
MGRMMEKLDEVDTRGKYGHQVPDNLIILVPEFPY